MVHSVPYIEVPIGALCCFLFLMFSFFNTQKSEAVRYFQLVILSCIIWSGGAALMRLQVSPGIRFWYNISLLGLFLMPIGIYCFLFCMLGIRKFRLLLVSGILSIGAIVLNSLWDIILAPPTVLEQADGSVRYTYTMNNTVYLVIFVEVLLCAYVVNVTRRRVNYERSFSKKLIPMLIGIAFILVGNCLELIPGNTFPWSTLGGVGMAICFAYIMYRQYMFEVSYSMLIGSVYIGALIAVIVPIVILFANFQAVMNGAEKNGEQHIWMIIAVFCAWSAGVMVCAHEQADKIAERKSHKMLERVQQFQEETSSLFSEKVLYEKIREVLVELFREVHVYIYIRNESSGRFEQVLREAEDVLTDKEEQKVMQLIEQKRTKKTRGRLTLLRYDQKVQGFIYLKFSSREPLNYMETECFYQVSNHASICLKNIRIFEEVYQVSIHDELTGLYNRTYWKQYMKEQLLPQEEHSFIHVDIDDFKLINELYGGNCGDSILRWCGRVISETVKQENGTTFRVGSNEFLIDLRSNDKESLLALAKNIQKNVRKEDEDKPKILQPITFSIGIARYPATAKDFDELLQQAQKATFFAKKNGKNRVELYEIGIEGNDEETSSDKAYEQVAPTVYALMAAIDAKDSYTFMHSTHVSEYAVLLAREIGLKNNEIQIVKEAGLLHDIGKIGIPEHILKKQDKLTDEEYSIMKKHVSNSIEMIQFLPNMSYVIPAVVSHHERFDGKGYPRGIAGEEIPLPGRILAVCDSFDAMISKRSYKESMSIEYAMEELEKNKGTQFDPRLAEAFIKLIKEGKVKKNEPESKE